MSEITAYFIRHGEVYNPKRILYGRLPGFPLSEKGRSEAGQAADKLKNRGIKKIYTSPLLRARQTSDIIGKKLNLKTAKSLYLTELRMIFQGMDADEYKVKIQPYLFSPEYVKKGQESVDETFIRMSRFFDNIVRNNKDKTVLIVSHGDPISIFVAKTSGREFTWNYKKSHYLKTAHFIRLEYKNGVYKWFLEN
jgi:broad specificity phosphatase PhoE